MNFRVAIAMTGCVLLAACGGGESGADNGAPGANAAAGTEAVENSASAAETAGIGGGSAAAGSDGRLRAGQWEMKTEFAGMAGMPKGMLDMMNSKSKPMTICISEEEASRPDGTLFTGQDSPDCKSEGFSSAGGRIQGKVTCAGDQGKTTVTMDGQIGPDSFTMTQRMTMDGPMAGTTETKVSGRRLGDCPAGAEA